VFRGTLELGELIPGVPQTHSFFYKEISEHNLIDSACISGFSPILRASLFLLYLQCKLVMMKFHKHG
jgi:hypothetical protein